MPIGLHELEFAAANGALNHITRNLFRDTHGQPHPTLLSVMEDLKYLEVKGVDIDKVWLVLEVAETDYSNRPNLIHEIKLLQEAELYRR